MPTRIYPGLDRCLDPDPAPITGAGSHPRCVLRTCSSPCGYPGRSGLVCPLSSLAIARARGRQLKQPTRAVRPCNAAQAGQPSRPAGTAHSLHVAGSAGKAVRTHERTTAAEVLCSGSTRLLAAPICGLCCSVRDGTHDAQDCADIITLDHQRAKTAKCLVGLPIGLRCSRGLESGWEPPLRHLAGSADRRLVRHHATTVVCLVERPSLRFCSFTALLSKGFVVQS